MMDIEILALPFIEAWRWLLERNALEWGGIVGIAFGLSRFLPRRKPDSVKVLTPGQLAKDREYKFTCGCCGCEFEFAGRDAMVWHVGSVLFVKRACPFCREEVSNIDAGNKC